MIYDDCDIVFVCEYWLKPCDIPAVILSYQSNNVWTNIKSGMQINDTYIGRTFDGVGFIARKKTKINVHDLMQEDNRISVVQLLYNGTIWYMHTIPIHRVYHTVRH